MKRALYVLLISFLVVACSTDSWKESIVDDKYSSSAESSGEDPNGNSNQQIEPGQITAGEWNDLSNWTFWNNLEQNQSYSKMPQYWSYNLSNRVSVQLLDEQSNKLINYSLYVVNAADEVLWESMTDNQGKAELWPSLWKKQASYEGLKIVAGNQTFNDIKFFSEGINILTVKTTSPPPTNASIDIAFMIDATGSMGDEMEYLKVELVDIIKKVKVQKSNATINIASVFYRDIDDEYVTRKSDFTTDMDKTIEFIKKQHANGGGDFPEAVHTALNVTLKALQWTSTTTSRIVFMVLDAPPHYEAQIVSDIHASVRNAAERGIKLIPVVASGIDKETEFLMRYMAIATNGTYVFITNHSGIGNEHLEPSIGEYQVEYLNELLVRLIDQYLELE